jgi:hypothetical protein
MTQTPPDPAAPADPAPADPPAEDPWDRLSSLIEARTRAVMLDVFGPPDPPEGAPGGQSQTPPPQRGTPAADPAPGGDPAPAPGGEPQRSSKPRGHFLDFLYR